MNHKGALRETKPTTFEAVRVHVTKKDIEAGEKHDLYKCPIAVSLNRRFPGTVVGTETTTLRKPGDKYAHASLPVKAIDFTHIFDSGGDVSPIRFTIYAGWEG